MKARLFAKTGDFAESSYEIGTEAVIGRAESCDIRLRHPLLSRRHARITWDADEGSYVLEDLASANGTQLDGLPVHEPERLGRLEVVTFAGVHDFIFQLLDDSPGEPRARGAPRPDRRPDGGFRLVIAGTPHPLREGENVVGRSHDAHVRLDSAEVSRRHALLTVDGTSVTLEDLGSRNGTFLASERVTGRVAIEPGDRIRLGSLLATLDGG